MDEPERWQCIALTRTGEACSRIVPFSEEQLAHGLQPVCHQHMREMEEGLQREKVGSAVPSLSFGLRRCIAVRRVRDGRAVRCGKPAPCLSLRGAESQVVSPHRLCDEHRWLLSQAFMREWQARQAATDATGDRSGWRLGIRPG